MPAKILQMQVAASCELAGVGIKTVCGIYSKQHLINKSIAMTNKEILQADLLDILFENRNKAYGAYALRKTYNNRMGIALAGVFALIMLTILLSSFKKKNGDSISANTSQKRDSVKLTIIDMTPPKLPEQPKPVAEKPAAQTKYTQINIVEDKKYSIPPPDMSDLDKTDISDKTVNGEPPTGIVKPVEPPSITNGNGKTNEDDGKFIASEIPPSYPGGVEALSRFLANNLTAPEDMEPGQKVVVQLRFVVDVDGSISKLEVVKSGGNAYDREVIRVFKRMPKWKPGSQNGHPVTIAFTQPVTFVGQEN
jgi:periplasmic protein TonB